MSKSEPVSQPEKTNQTATSQSNAHEIRRLKNVRGLIAGRTGEAVFSADIAGANVPEDVGLSGGTLGTE
jgi:hypothetical protein